MDEPVHDPSDGSSGTRGEDYAQRLQTKRDATWKRLLNVQAPYRWNLRRQHLGRTLDVGCGLGRNLETLDPGSVGVDHNASSVRIARESGLDALTVEEWLASPHRVPDSFDGLLLAHVVEHMTPTEAEDLLREYLPYVRPGGTVMFICPQERGYASDATHVTFMTGEDLRRLATAVGLLPESPKSFPFPRWAGRGFTYNEFTLLARKPA